VYRIEYVSYRLSIRLLTVSSQPYMSLCENCVETSCKWSEVLMALYENPYEQAGVQPEFPCEWSGVPMALFGNPPPRAVWVSLIPYENPLRAVRVPLSFLREVWGSLDTVLEPNTIGQGPLPPDVPCHRSGSLWQCFETPCVQYRVSLALYENH